MNDQKGQGVNRIFDIIEIVAANPEGITVTEISRAASLPKTTVHRLVGFLTEKNYLERLGEEYRLGFKFIALAGDYYSRIDLRSVASPFLRSLATEFGGTAHLALRQGDYAVYIDKIQPYSYGCMYSEIGKSIELYCSALGKSLLLGLDEKEYEDYFARLKVVQYTENTLTAEGLKQEIASARLTGVSFDNAEHEKNSYCVAAPVYDFCGRIIAAISLTSQNEKALTDEALIKAVKEKARNVSALFGKKA